jgi:hypothetical protein
MKRISILLLVATALAIPACSNDVTPGDDDDDTGSGSGSGSGSQDEWDQLLGTRVTDYSAALKIAALRLTGDIPTLAEIKSVGDAPEAGKAAAYETLVRDYISRPTFARQMFYFWRDTFKMGGTAATDTAPAFAAELSTNNGNYTELFTRATNNCPTFNEGTSVFTAGECNNGGPKAGVLTNPGMNALYTSNLGFRRVRWVQEIFDCIKYPAELGTTAQEVGGALPYQGVWPFTSIAGTANGGRVNFLDTSSAMCAHCHSTMNHRAPLFANYDANGMYQTAIAVTLPLEGAPLARMSDFLPAGETPAWRHQQPAADLPAFGAAMAADPRVAECGVARLWNFAFGNTDIVDTLREVPRATIQEQLDAFTQSGFKMKDLIVAIFLSNDFVKF